MDNNEIAPAPVTTAEDLFGKLDMILSATRQWINNDDDELGAVIYRRLNEIPNDATVLHSTPEHWNAFNEKVTAINHAHRVKNHVSLSALYSLN